MNDKFQIQADWTVEKTLQQRPATSNSFVKHRTQCVGCLMQKFCTIGDVAKIYELDLSEFLQDFNQSTFKSSAA